MIDLSQPGMHDIAAAIGRLQSGDRAGAIDDLMHQWASWSDREAPLQRSVLAHFIADTQDDVADELKWDLLALDAATTTDDPALAGFLPSLHLNVGDAYRRMGQDDAARDHAMLGMAEVHHLADDPYGKLIRNGLERLLATIGTDAAPR